jgi:hypothetical protein
MKKKHLILIIAGIAIAYFLIKANKKVKQPISIIRPGDKSNEVYGLQNTLSVMTGLKFDSMGAYDNDTLNAVRYYLQDSNALLDYEKGYVDEKFASDLYLIQNKVKS